MQKQNNERLFKDVKDRVPGAIEEMLTANTAYLITVAKTTYKNYHGKCEFEDVLQTFKQVFYEKIRQLAEQDVDWDQKILAAIFNEAKRVLYDTYKNSGDYSYGVVLTKKKQGDEKTNKQQTSYDDLCERVNEGHVSHGDESIKNAISTTENGDIYDDLYLQEIQSHIGSLIAELPERDKLFLIEFFLEGKTKKAIAAEAGVSEMTVARHLKKSLAILRNQITDFDMDVKENIMKLLH